MPKTTLYITRHGQTQWNVEKRMQGHLDSPLTELGMLQATWLGEALHHVPLQAIYASSSLRAQHTASLIRGQRHLDILTDDNLREIKLGSWEGQLGAAMRAEYPQESQAFWTQPDLYQPVPGGESFYDLQNRVLPFIQELITRHEGQSILIVTHAITLKTIMNHLLQRPLSQLWDPPIIEPTSLSKIILENQTIHIELHGDTSHYRSAGEISA